MTTLFSSFKIKSHEIKNRIVFPPFVNFGWSDENGKISQKNVEQYEAIAKGGAGLIIVEATCVEKDGRIFSYQPGIWSDDHIEQFKPVTEACHKHGTVILLQIHHAGLATRKGLSERVVGPSAHADIDKSHALTVDEINQLKDKFIAAAARAEKAGFDGVEIHGAHGYLLSQFANSVINLRTDEYGGSHDNRLRLAIEIIRGIRKSSNSNFIIGYRMSGNSPTLADGVEVAKILDKEEIDLLHVSHGGEKGIIPEVPSDFAYNGIVFNGVQVKKHVKTPVIAVNEIRTPKRASWLIESGYADFVAIGRDMACDYEWANKAQSGEKIDFCISCKPKCKRYVKAESCPVIIGKSKKVDKESSN
jgi:2,4-dienoyl-CoA reductase-like NADH-dependent reductase (Old Yellow Enzyme family)